MRWGVIIIGVLLDLLGTIWILQGLNVLPGSRMSGEPFWAGAGLVAIVIGLAVLVVSIRRGAGSGIR